MAFMLEFSDYLRSPQHRTPPGRRPLPVKTDNRPSELLAALEMMSGGSVLESHSCKNGRTCLGFTLEAAGDLTAFFQVELDGREQQVRVGASILQGGSLCRLKSSEILKNLCRTLRSVNSLASRYPLFFAVGPMTRELLLKGHSFQLPSTQQLIPMLRSFLTEASFFLKSFSPLLLYSANLMARSSVETYLQPSLRNFFFGPQGDFSRYAEIYELMPLVNCPLEVEAETCTLQEEDENEVKNSNPKRIIQLLYDQKKNPDKKELVLFSEPEAYTPETPLYSFRKDAQGLNYPSLRDGSVDHPYIFNTINVTSHDKMRERVLAEGGKAKIVVSPTKFFYAKSMDVPKAVPAKKKDEMDMDEESTEETDEGQVRGVQLDRALLVKMPKGMPKDKEWKKLQEQISYQKEVLANLRSVGCAYIPKYYHSIQEKYAHRPFLLMDYVPGITLTEEMGRRKDSFTSSGKLHILTHLSNALRFLSDHSIAHLDLSPNNIMVVKDFLVKLIDFGQAYHPKVSKKYTPAAAKGDCGRFVYSPGRTFPYAPPETSSRYDSFSSQQDMYSLGVIMHQLLFSSFPFECQQETHKQLYLERTYPERLLLAPERAELYGQLDFSTLLMNLTMKLLDCDERRRPHPVWAHIIIKKLFYAIR